MLLISTIELELVSLIIFAPWINNNIMVDGKSVFVLINRRHLKSLRSFYKKALHLNFFDLSNVSTIFSSY